MKSLVEFIKESTSVKVTEATESTSLTFDFTGLENAEETLKSLVEMEGCSVEDNMLTVTVTADNVDKLGTVQDILQQFTETIRNSQKRSSDEQYAQKTKKFAEKVAEFNNKLDEIANPEEE